MGLKTSTYSQMERRGNITAEKLILLSEILETDIQFLLFGEEKSPSKKQNDNSSFSDFPIQKDARHLIIEVTVDDYNLLCSFWALNKKNREIAHQYIYDMLFKK